MRNPALWFSLMLVLSPAAASAGDEQGAVPPPQLPRGGSPPSPAASSPSAAASADVESRLDAIERALARIEAAQSSGPQAAGPAAPYASPQAPYAAAPPRPARLAIVPAERPRAVGTVPAYTESREYVQVLVPAPCHKRALAALGEKMVQCGQPRVRTMRVAPASLVTVQEVPTVTARPVYASGQGGS